MDVQVRGTTMPVLEVRLDPGEKRDRIARWVSCLTET